MQKQKAQQENAIIEGVIWKQLLIFFFPILLGSFFQQMYNTADTIIVGQFAGKLALAAVGSTGSYVNLLFGFFVGLASGATWSSWRSSSEAETPRACMIRCTRPWPFPCWRAWPLPLRACLPQS